MLSLCSLADRLETLSDQPYSSCSRSTTSCIVKPARTICALISLRTFIFKSSQIQIMKQRSRYALQRTRFAVSQKFLLSSNPFRIAGVMSCSQVTPTDFSVPCDLVSNRVIPHVSAHSLSCFEKHDSVKPFLPSVKNFADFTCLDFMPENIGSAGQHSSHIAAFGVKRCVHTYTARRQNQSCHPSGTYVRSETSENPFILGLAIASIPKKPQTRRPAAFVILLQYSRLYLFWLAITLSLKLRRFNGVRLFSSHHIR